MLLHYLSHLFISTSHLSIRLFLMLGVFISIPIFVRIKKIGGQLSAAKATLASGGLMYGFLFLGDSFLQIVGLHPEGFKAAGGLILFFIGLEFILHIEIFKMDSSRLMNASLIPIAFPMVAGMGTLTTIFRERAKILDSGESLLPLCLAIAVNLLIIFLVIYYAERLAIAVGEQTLLIYEGLMGTVFIGFGLTILRDFFVLGLHTWTKSVS